MPPLRPCHNDTTLINAVAQRHHLWQDYRLPPSFGSLHDAFWYHKLVLRKETFSVPNLEYWLDTDLGDMRHWDKAKTDFHIHRDINYCCVIRNKFLHSTLPRGSILLFPRVTDSLLSGLPEGWPPSSINVCAYKNMLLYTHSKIPQQQVLSQRVV